MKTVEEGKTLTSRRGKPERGGHMEEVMTRLELLTLLYSIQALMDTGNTDKAKEIIEKVIREAERPEK